MRIKRHTSFICEKDKKGKHYYKRKNKILVSKFHHFGFGNKQSVDSEIEQNSNNPQNIIGDIK